MGRKVSVGFRVNSKRLLRVASAGLFGAILVTCDTGLGAKVDVTPPKVVISSPTTSGGYYQGTLSIKGTATDDLGITSVQVSYSSVDGSPATAEAALSDGNWSLDLKSGEGGVLAEGKNIISVAVHDASGKSATDSTLVYIDNIAPTVMVQAPSSYDPNPSKAPLYSDYIDVKGEVFDRSPLESVKITLYRLSDFSTIATQTAEGTSTFSSRFFLKKAEPHLTDALLNPSDANASFAYTVVATDRAGNVNSWTFHRQDIYAAISQSRQQLQLPDSSVTVFPTVDELGAIDGSASDLPGSKITHSSVEAVRTSVAQPRYNFAYMHELMPTIRFISVNPDSATNIVGVNSIISGTIQPPPTAGSSIDPSSVQSKVYATTNLATPLFQESGATANQELRDLGGNLSYSLALKNGATILAPGSYRLILSAQAFGSSTVTKTVDFFIDSGAPYLDQLASTNTGDYLNSPATLGGSASSPTGLDHVDIWQSFNGGTETLVKTIPMSGTSATWSSGPVPASPVDGSYDYTISLTTTSGKVTRVYHSFTWDVSIPQVSVNSVGATSGIPVSGTPVVANFGASDTNGVTEIRWWLLPSAATRPSWDTAGFTSKLSTPYRGSFDSTLLAEGNYNLWLSAHDKSGNENWSDPFEVVVDQAAPVLSLGSSPSVVTAAGAASFAGFSGTISDSNTTAAPSLKRSVIRNGGTAATTTIPVASDGTWSSAFPVNTSTHAQDGVYIITFTATDAAARTTAQTVTLTVDTESPHITSTSPGASQWYSSTTLSTSGSVTDPSDSQGPSVVWLKATADNVNVSAEDPSVANGWKSATVSGTSWNANLTVAGEGRKTLWIKAIDALGNATTSAEAVPGSIPFGLDSTPPSLSFTDSTPTLLRSGFVLTGTATDSNPAAPPGITVSADGGTAQNLTLASGQWTYSPTLPADGTHTYVFTVTDVAGKTTTLSRSISVDTSPPTAVISSPSLFTSSDSGYWLSGATAGFSGSASDVGLAGVAGVYYLVDAKGSTHAAANTSTWPLASGNTNWSVTSGLSAEGEFTLWVAGRDNAGNLQAPVSRNYGVDQNPPTVTEINPAQWSTRLAFDLSGTVGDTNGLSGIRITENKNSTGPIVVLDLPRTGTTQTWTKTGLPSTGVSDGTYVYVITATDVAGKTFSITRTVTIDTTPPVLTLTSPSEGQVGVNSLSSKTNLPRGTADDGIGVGVVKILYRIDQSSTPSANLGDYTPVVTGNGTWSFTDPDRTEGGYWIHVIAEDAAGNRSTPLNRTFDIDVAAPVLKETTMGSAVFPSKTGLDISGTWKESNGVASFSVTQTKDGGTPVTIPTGVNFVAVSGASDTDAPWLLAGLPRDPDAPASTLVGDGFYEYQFTMTDVVGKTTVLTRSVRIDSTPPVVNITSPTTGQVGINAVLGATLTLQGNASDVGSGLAKLYYKIDNSPTAEVGIGAYTSLTQGNGTWSVVRDLDTDGPGGDLGLAEGVWYLHVKAEDKFGNLTADADAINLRFDHDQAKPSLVVDALASAKNTAFGLSGTASDTHAVASVSVTQKRDSGTAVTLTPTGTTTWALTNLPRNPASPADLLLTDGVYEYTITVTDAVGKTETATHTIKVDQTAPSLTITEPAADAWMSTPSVNVKGIATDGTGVGSITVQFSTDGTNWNATSGSTDWTAALTGLTAGYKTVWLRASDGLANVSASISRSFWVDLAAPTLTETEIGSSLGYRNNVFSLGGDLGDDVDLKSFSLRQKKDAGGFVTIAGGALAVTSLSAANDTSGTWLVTDLPRDPLNPGNQSLAAGVFEYEISITDGNNRTTTMSRTVTVDTVSPNLDITSILPILSGNRVNGKVTLSVSASDAYGLDGVRYWLKTGVWTPLTADFDSAGSTNLAAPYSTSLNTTLAPFADNTSYTIWVGARDKAGNVTWQSQGIAVDQASDRPSGTVDSPTTLAQLGADKTLRGTFSDDDGVALTGASLYIRKVGGSWGTPIDLNLTSTAGQLVAWSVNVASKLSTDGLYEAYLSLSDDLTKKQGLSASTSFWPSVDAGLTANNLQFYYDSTPPVVSTVTWSPVKAAYRAGEAVTFSWTASDTSGLTSQSVDVEGLPTGLGAITNPSGSNFQVIYTVPASGVSSGSKTLTLVVEDTTGRTTTKAVSFVIDVDAPAVESAFTLSPTFVGFTPNGAFDLKGTASDNRGLASVEVQLSGPTYSDPSWTAASLSNGSWTFALANSATYVATSGTLTINVRATDSAGNVSTTQVLTQTVDQAADKPTTEILSPVDLTTYGTTVQLSGTAKDDDGLADLNNDGILDADAVQIEYWNTATPGTKIPVVPSLIGSGKNANWNATLSSLSGATYAMRVRSKDDVGAGLTGDWSAPVTFTVNSGAPQLLVSTTVNSYRNAASLTLSGTVSDSDGVQNVQIRVNGGSWSQATGTSAWGAGNTADTWTLTIGLGADGLKTLEIQAIDMNNFVANQQLTTTLDTTPPSGTFDAQFRDNPSGSFLTLSALNKVVRVTGSVTELNLVDASPVELSIDGGGWAAVSGTFVWSQVWDTTLLPNTTHTLSLRVTDKAGNQSVIGPIAVTTNQGADNPVTTTSNVISAPNSASAANNILGSSPKISGTISDDDGFLAGAVDLYLDGSATPVSATNTLGTSGTWEYTWASLAQGEHYVTFTSTDRNGQNATIGPYYFIVDTSAPTLDVLTPNSGIKVKAGTLIISGTTSDGGGLATSQPVAVRLTHSDSGSPLNNTTYYPTVSAGAWSQSIAISALSLDGLLTIEVTSTDRAGKQTTQTKNITIDTTAPTVVLGYPSSGSYINGLVDVTGNADDLNGLSNVTLQILNPSNLNLPVTSLTRSGTALSSWGFSFNSLLYASSGFAQDLGGGTLWKVWLRIAATDTSGNVTEVKTGPGATDYPFIIIDTNGDKPSISVSQPKNGDKIGGIVTMYGTATDDDGPVMQVEVQIDFNGDGDFADTRDIDGDLTTSTGTNTTIYGNSVRIGDPAHKWEDESAWYVVTATNNIWTLELNTNGELYSSRTAGNGDVVIRVRSRDQYGLASEYTQRTITLDETFPRIDTVLPGDQSYVSGTFHVTASLGDNIDLNLEDANYADGVGGGNSQIRVNLNKAGYQHVPMGQLTAHLGATQHGYDLDLPINTNLYFPASSGILYVDLYVKDESGYISQRSYTYYVDNQPPTSGWSYDASRTEATVKDRVLRNSDASVSVSGVPTALTWLEGFQNDSGTVSGLDRVEVYFTKPGETSLRQISGGTGTWGSASTESASTETWSGSVWNAANTSQAFATNAAAGDDYVMRLDQKTEVDAATQPFTRASSVDADPYLEYGQILDTKNRFGVFFDSSNLPDGPIDVHYVVYDKAGNRVHKVIRLLVANNGPLIASLTVGADLNGNNSSADAGEKQTFGTFTNGQVNTGLMLKNKYLSVDISATKGNGSVTAQLQHNGSNVAGASVNLTGTTTKTGTITLDNTNAFWSGWSSGNDTALNSSAFTVVLSDATPSEALTDQKTANVGIDNIDAVLPTVTLNQLVATDYAVSGSTPLGHVEPWTASPFNNTDTGFGKTNEVYGNDADVSGTIVFSGSAWDDQRVTGLVVWIDLNGNGSIDAGEQQTVTQVNASTNFLENNPSNTLGTWSATSQSIGQSGHAVNWTLTWNSANVASRARANVAVEISVLDLGSNGSLPLPSGVLTGSTAIPTAKNRLRVDVAPYIASVVTRVNSLVSKDFNRSATGKYTVWVNTTTGVNTFETVTVNGFNLNPSSVAGGAASDLRLSIDPDGLDAGMTVRQGSGLVGSGVALPYTSLSVQMATAASTAVAGGGYLTVLTNGVPSLNNVNDPNLTTNKETTTVHLALGDDRAFQIWNLNTLRTNAAAPLAANATYATMAINGNTPVFAFVNNAFGYGLAEYWNGTATSEIYEAWDLFTHSSLDLNANGSRAALYDINIVSGGNDWSGDAGGTMVNFFYDPPNTAWGSTANYYRAYNVFLDNLNKPANLAVLGRYNYPDIAVIGDDTLTTAFYSTYDSIDDRILFRTFNAGTNSTSVGSTNNLKGAQASNLYTNLMQFNDTGTWPLFNDTAAANRRFNGTAPTGVNATAMSANFVYQIRNPGTTNFVAVGAANNRTGTIFKPTAAGTGTGTLVQLSNAAPVLATTTAAGNLYYVVTLGTSDFRTIGAPANAVGTVFVASGVGTGTGTVSRLNLNNSGASSPGVQVLQTGTGQFSAVEATSTGVALITYYKSLTNELVYRYNTTPTVEANWSAEVVLDTDVGGDFVDMVVENTGGTPTNVVHIAYHDSFTGDLKYVRLNTYNGAFSGPFKVDSYLTVGNKASLAVSSSGVPYIAYKGMGNTAKVAWLTGSIGDGTDANDKFLGNWESAVIPNKIVDSDTNRFSIGVGSDGRPVIGYSNADSSAKGLEYLTKLNDLPN